MSVVDRFKALVPIDNPSGGEDDIRDYIEDELVHWGEFEHAVDDAGNLLVRVPGDPGKTPILLSAHMDSVPPCHGIVPVEDVLEGRSIIRSEGKTILGADDKSGIAVILEVVARLSAGKFQQNHPLELLFSTREEVGLLGAKAFDMQQVKARYAYVLDGEGFVGDVFHAGPSQENIQIICHGRASHAGIQPEEGISAIQLAAAVCSRVPSGRLSPALTTNIGTVQGGAAINVIPPEAVLKGEARGHEESGLADLLDQYRRVCQAVESEFPGSRIEFITTRRYDRFTVDPQHESIQRAVEAGHALHLPVRVLPMNIGSDAHVLNHAGLPTVILGMGFHYSHSLGEYIDAAGLELVADWVMALVA